MRYEYPMTLRKIIMSVRRDKYSRWLLDEWPSKFCYINPKPKSAMPAQSRASVLAVKVDGIFSVHFSKSISTKRRVTDRRKRIWKPCANGVYGSSLCLAKRKSFIVWGGFAWDVYSKWISKAWWWQPGKIWNDCLSIILLRFFLFSNALLNVWFPREFSLFQQPECFCVNSYEIRSMGI